MYHRTICLFTYLGMGGAMVAEKDHHGLLVHRLRLLKLALQRRRNVFTNISHIHVQNTWAVMPAKGLKYVPCRRTA
jgi:hypothetical protein